MSAAPMVDAQRLSLMLGELRLPTIKHIWGDFAAQADKEWELPGDYGAIKWKRGAQLIGVVRFQAVAFVGWMKFGDESRTSEPCRKSAERRRRLLSLSTLSCAINKDDRRRRRLAIQ